MKVIHQHAIRHVHGKYLRQAAYPVRYPVPMKSDKDLISFVNTHKRDCFTSVFYFNSWELKGDKAVMLDPVIDTVYLDLDHKQLVKAWAEAKAVVSFFMRNEVIPRVYFSGSKGFALYIDFPAIRLMNPREVLRRFCFRLVDTLKLKTADSHVFGDINRVSRLPGTVNSKSVERFGEKLYCTPLDPEWFLENTSLDEIIEMARTGNPDYSIRRHETIKIAELLKKADLRVVGSKAVAKLKRHRRRFGNNGRGWREKRIRYYAEVLQRRGRLTADPEIAQRHGDEHAARLHLLFLCFEQGMSDEEIHSIFRFAENYRPERTQYFIDYNRRRYDSKGGVANAD